MTKEEQDRITGVIIGYNLETGLLLNFGSNSLQFKRLFNKKYNPNLVNPENLDKIKV